MKDAYWRFRRQTAVVIVLGGASLALQLAALALIFASVRSLESGEALDLVVGVFEPRQSTALLFVIGGLILLLFSSSVALGYAARIQALGLGRQYEEHCAKRSIALVRERAGSAAMRSWSSFRGPMLDSYPRYCGRVARMAVGMALPACSFVAMAIVLLYLDPLLTVVLALLSSFVVPILYVVNVRGASMTYAIERVSPSAIAAKRELANAAGKQLSAADREENVDASFRSGPIRELIDAYTGRLRAIEEATLTANLTFAGALAVIFFQKGPALLTQGGGWSELTVYIIALRATLASLSQLMRGITAINRFYPQVARYARFVRDMNDPSFVPDQRSTDFVPAETDASD